MRAPGASLLLYMLALAGGALTAHMTAPGPSGASATFVTAPQAQAPTGRAEANPPDEAPHPEAVTEAATETATHPVPPAVVGQRAGAAGTLLPMLEPAMPSLRSDSHDALAAAFKRGKIITGSTPHRLILFSFDDGPDRRHTPLLLDRLDAERVKALFFLTASRLQGRNLAERQQAAIARDIAARGHIVASHTLDHAQLPLLDDEAAMAQVVEAEQIFERVLGARPWLFRPPGGAHSGRIDALLAERGYTTVLWNLGAGDFQVRSAQEVFETWQRVFERREKELGERGGIILLHDTYAWSVDAFQMILAELRARNCDLLARGEELFDIVDDPSLFFQPRADEGPSAEASPARLPASVLSRRQERVQREALAACSGL